MTVYDWLLIFLAGGLVVMFTFVRMVRGLLMLFIVWTGTFLSALLYQEAAFRVQAIAGNNPVLARGVVFDILLTIFLVVGYIVTVVAFPVTKLPKLGILDNLMGLVLGVVIAAIVVSLLVNSMGVMTIEQWGTNLAGWSNLHNAYVGSGLRPLTSRVLLGYAWLFAPFFPGLPPVLLPQ